jgi:hypothetical protein
MRTYRREVAGSAWWMLVSARTTRQTRRSEKGQSLVELALVLPIFILLLMAAGEYGLTLREQGALTQALQQAAQYLAYHPAISGCPSGALGWNASTTGGCAGYLSKIEASPYNDVTATGTFSCASEFPVVSTMASSVGCSTTTSTTSCAQEYGTLHNIALGSVGYLNALTNYAQANPTAPRQTIYGECSSYIVASYLQEHGFNAPGMSVAVLFSSNTFNQQQDVISVTYPYQLVLPLFDRINACPSSTNAYGVSYPRGALCIGVSVSVTAATEAPTIVAVAPGTDGSYNNQSGHSPPTVYWTPPYNPTSASLTYNLYNCVMENPLSACATDPAVDVHETGQTGVTTATSLCSATDPTSICSTSDALCTSTNCEHGTYSYEVTAVQPDTSDASTNQGYGIQSPRSQYVYPNSSGTMQSGGPGS